ncbi:XVIPCD domain-containing protein [Pseudoxanthomonas sp.]|uniref:XVIPCD domain-containing protein n=1 Tax=Pseudoxanthomonas sp. TaxID=1871049 RepID=UPI0025CFFC65|nr:XVIPCD domain-containing protein [Pseudoxanthomonas sp.]
MVKPNPQLEAALARFAAQPGATPVLEAQLRAAVLADPNRLNVLNQQAVTRQLQGFALEMSSTSPSLIGTYDKQAGVITLPATSFRPVGTTASDDLKAVIGLQAITVDFAYKTWQDHAGKIHAVDQDMVTNLQSALNGSPVLADQMKDAIRQGHVQHFSLLGNGMAAGATYDGNTVRQDGTPKGINLSPSGLQTNTPANPLGRYDVRDMTFVLGHEIRHGFNNAAKDNATGIFVRSITVQAKAQGHIHDYTDELRAYIQAGREDEAKAEIAGWNALLSRERQLNPSMPGLDMMADAGNDRTLDFVQRDPVTKALSINQGLTFNQDGSLSQNPANIAAMGQHYFDRPSHVHAQPGQRPVGIGEHKPNPTADYPNYYGTWALEQIVAAEDRANVSYKGARPQIAIDMAVLGLKENLIEMEGLDLGANKAPRPYLDTSQIPAKPGHFHHTQDASMGHDHQHVPIVAAGRIRASGDPVVDRWIDALQVGDQAAAKVLQKEFTESPDGRRLWVESLADAQAWEARQKPWLAQARDTPLFNQAMDHLERLEPQMDAHWTQRQREQLAGTIALEARRDHLPEISALVQTRDGGLMAVWNHPHNPILDRRTDTINPAQASEQPLRQSMQAFNEETQRQEQQTIIDAQQRQVQEQQQGMAR